MIAETSVTSLTSEIAISDRSTAAGARAIDIWPAPDNRLRLVDHDKPPACLGQPCGTGQKTIARDDEIDAFEVDGLVEFPLLR